VSDRVKPRAVTPATHFHRRFSCSNLSHRWASSTIGFFMTSSGGGGGRVLPTSPYSAPPPPSTESSLAPISISFSLLLSPPPRPGVAPRAAWGVVGGHCQRWLAFPGIAPS